MLTWFRGNALKYYLHKRFVDISPAAFSPLGELRKKDLFAQLLSLMDLLRSIGGEHFGELFRNRCVDTLI